MMKFLFFFYLLLGGLLTMPTKRPAAVVMGRPAARVSSLPPRSHAAAKSPMKASGVAAARVRGSSGLGARKNPPSKKSKQAAKQQAVVATYKSQSLAEEDDEADDDFENDRVVDPAPGSLSYYDALARGAGKAFPGMLAKLKPGKALQAIHFLENGLPDVEALYFVHEVLPDPDGALVNASFIGASGKAHSDIQNVQDGSDHMLHLCRNTNGCRSHAMRTGVQHVLEWAPANKGQLTSSWITPSMVRTYTLLRDRHRTPKKASSSMSVMPAAGNKTSQKQQRRAQALLALKSARPFSDSESSGKPLRPSALKSSRTGLGAVTKPAGAPAAAPDVSEFPPLPPPSSEPGIHAISDDKSLMLLKQLAETNLTEKEIEDAAGPVDSAHDAHGKEEVLAKLKGRLNEIKKKYDEESARRSRGGTEKSKSSREAGSGRKSERSESSLLARLAADKSMRKRNRDRSSSDHAGAEQLLGTATGEDAATPVLTGKGTDSSDSGRDRRSSKKRKKKSRKRKRRGRSPSAESGTSSSGKKSSCSDELFHDAGSSANGLANRVSMTAAKRPGRLLKQTLQAMLSSLNPLAPKLKSNRPAVVFQYLQKALSPSAHLNRATQRELGTLALAADKILKGDLEPALEILLQRFKAVESVATGTLSGAVAQNLEVIPQSEVSSLGLSERTEAVALDRRWSKVKSQKDSNRSPSPFRANQSQPPGRF